MWKNTDMTSTAGNRARNIFEGKEANLGDVFDSSYWLAKLAYLSDINILNELNLSLQGQLCNIFVMNDKIKAFKRKPLIWSKTIDIVIYIMSPQCCQIVLDKHTVTMAEPEGTIFHRHQHGKHLDYILGPSTCVGLEFNK
jgi:hypothetical protein